MRSSGSQRRAGSRIHSVMPRLQNVSMGLAGNSKTRLPSIRSHSTSPTGKESYNPGCPWDRFTKLKGSLVNGILSKYNKQGGQSSKMRPDLVYNIAVVEVDKILRRGKVTEESLRDLQDKFAAGIMSLPTDFVPLKSKPSRATSSMQTGATARGMPGRASGAEEAAAGGTGDGQGQENVLLLSGDGEREMEGDAGKGAGGKGWMKVGTELDEWTMMTLLKDIKHLEEQKRLKAVKEEDKMHQAAFLNKQLEWRQEQRRRSIEERKQYAAELESKARQHVEEEERVMERKRAKVLVEKQEEAKVLEDSRRKRQATIEQERREAREQLAIYTAQLALEKEVIREQMQVKVKQYEEVVKANDKALERKKKIKEVEAAEQERLFAIQNDMYERQEAVRREAEEMRLQRLKKSERQGKELVNKHMEFQAKVHARFLEAKAKQERELQQDAERKAEQKMRTDAVMKRSLAEQMRINEERKEGELQEKRDLAARYQREAKEFEEEKRLEKLRAVQKRKEAAAMLAQQIETRKRVAHEVVMTRNELSINRKEVQDVHAVEAEEMLEKYRKLTVQGKPPKT